MATKTLPAASLPIKESDVERLAGVMYLAYHKELSDLFSHMTDIQFEPWEWVVENKATHPSLYSRWMKYAHHACFPESRTDEAQGS